VTDNVPQILFVNVYTALIYGIYYSFFEVFGLVYPVMYGFNVGETGLVFVCIIVRHTLDLPSFLGAPH
jgi:DHA1 family multidrug resistance protein-like MFS transporter